MTGPGASRRLVHNGFSTGFLDIGPREGVPLLLIHGSGPNRSKDRFRRAFICHYAAGSVEKVSKFYFPLLRMDGSEFEVALNDKGGACGQEWLGAVH